MAADGAAGAPPEDGVTIRRYRADDAPRVKAITAAAFAPVSVDAAVDRRWPGLAPVPWVERKWASMQPQLVGEPEHCWVAECAGEVVGYVTCEIRPDLGLGRIPDLAVDRAWRGRGLGRRLLEHALGTFRDLGLSLAKIETLAHNEVGRHLYPTLGFELVATQYHYVMPLRALSEESDRGPHPVGDGDGADGDGADGDGEEG
jgi:ribosomal protein S18 acetylase RimI-like enzyme